MKKIRNTYFSLGSNQGNRLQYLQKAIDLIAEKVGCVKSIANVYQTPALGFEGDNFYNTCIGVTTYLTNDDLIDTTLNIEKQIGRVRQSDKGYSNRPIDIDVLLIDNEIILSKNLIVPHPRMLERNFVLVPLRDIAPDFVHPSVKKTISNCFENSKDISEIQIAKESLHLPTNISAKYNSIAIEGNIGAGKTSLATMIAKQYSSKLILEQFSENPFLEKFYNNRERYAFSLEMKFLADRHQQLSNNFIVNSPQLIISDYYVFKSLIFAEITLSKDEFELYKTIFYLLYKDIPKPDLYVYLYQNTDSLLENIKKRGREYEKNIEAKYLEKIHQGYLGYINDQENLNTLIIDISELNFVDDAKNYNLILNQIINA